MKCKKLLLCLTLVMFLLVLVVPSVFALNVLGNETFDGDESNWELLGGANTASSSLNIITNSQAIYVHEIQNNSKTKSNSSIVMHFSLISGSNEKICFYMGDRNGTTVAGNGDRHSLIFKVRETNKFSFSNPEDTEFGQVGNVITDGTNHTFTLNLFGGTAVVYINETLTNTIDLNNVRGNVSSFFSGGIGIDDCNIQIHDIAFYNSTDRNQPELISDATDFSITAKDLYDDVALNNITISVSNSSFSFNTSTQNGTILLLNSSFRFGELYNIKFSVNDSGGYFNNTFANINITESSSFEGTAFQSVLRLIALDALNNQTIQAFTGATNLSSDTTTIGELLILIKNGNWQLNVTATGFDKLVTNFSIGPLQNNTFTANMGSIFNFKLIRESTNTPFEFNLTNSTQLNIFCPNETIQIIFNETNNVSQIVNCQFTLMQIVVDYGVIGSYFRTLIPPFSQKNITWYLIDVIQGDTAIQRVIQLLDLTGEFTNSILTVQRSIGNSIVDIIEQRFDISNQVNLFLIKDALYTLSIENANEDITLGNLIPTEAGTQTITLPKIDFVPREIILGTNITFSYTFNTSQSILRLQYLDITNRTELVRFTVFNDTGNGLSQLFQGESQNNASVTMTFNQARANTTYTTVLFVKHLDIANFTDRKIFYDFDSGSGTLNLEGWTGVEQIEIKKWFSWIFLFSWGLLFSRRYIGVGMTTMIIWLWLFKTWEWVEVSPLIFSFVALLAVIGWVVDSMRRN